MPEPRTTTPTLTSPNGDSHPDGHPDVRALHPPGPGEVRARPNPANPNVQLNHEVKPWTMVANPPGSPNRHPRARRGDMCRNVVRETPPSRAGSALYHIRTDRPPRIERYSLQIPPVLPSPHGTGPWCVQRMK